MKKVLTLISILLLTIILVSCHKNKDKDIVVGVSFEPIPTILNLIKEDIKKDGYNLVIKEQSLEVNNIALKDKELDANLIQHKYYLNAFNEATNSNLVIVQNIYHATYALYSSLYTNLEDLPIGSNITLPDDITNISRALYLLDQAGLIEVNDKTKAILTESDIISNPKELVFNKVPLISIANKYLETKLAVMYPTYARSLNLVGNSERLYVETADDVTTNYAISLAARVDNQNSDKINILIKHLTSEKVRNYLLDEYSWASKPAF